MWISRACAAQRGLKGFGGIRIKIAEDLRAALNHRDLGAQPLEELGKLHRHRATTENDQ